MRPFQFLVTTAASLSITAAVQAQYVGIPVFSVDWKSPTVSFPNSFTGVQITEGDVLAAQPLTPAFGFLPTPGILESGGFNAPAGLGLALHAGCIGHTGGTPCAVEVDALSYALDAIMDCNFTPLYAPPRWTFSVDNRALGNPSSGLPPTVYDEALCGEESADVFLDYGVFCGPLAPSTSVAGNTLYIDGNGIANCSGQGPIPGLGLIEPAPGDNLDALDVDLPDRFLPQTTCAYFSLDSAFFDPALSVFNSGSAAAHGFVGGDVLMSCPGCGPIVYATAAQLGLDFFGPDSDDLDALVLHENGIPGYQRSTTPYDWLSGASDMLFFSVRRGSSIVGQPDAFFGIPIEQGDILVPTGSAGSLPGIWIAAENLGLMTQRSIVGIIGDDLDALDTLHEQPPGTPFCPGDGSGTQCPCTNNGAPGRGCGNSANSLGGLLWANGTASISNDTVLLTCSGLPSGTTCKFLQGTVPAAGGFGIVFGDGLRCAAGSVIRMGTRVCLCGNREFGHNIPGDPQVHIAGGISSPGTYYYQVWYRNAAVFCTPAVFNTTNGYSITWTP